MTIPLEHWAAHVRSLTAAGIGMTADVYALALAGETLRRRAQAEDAASIAVDEAIDEYEAVLRSNEAIVTSAYAETTREELPALLAGLEARARTPIHRRKLLEADDLVDAMDTVIAVARAAHVAGVADASEVSVLAASLAQRVHDLRATLPDLWEVAAVRTESMGDDPRFPELYRCTAILAELAPSALGAHVAVRAATRVQNLLDRASKRGPKLADVIPLVGRVRSRIHTLGSPAAGAEELLRVAAAAPPSPGSVASAPIVVVAPGASVGQLGTIRVRYAGSSGPEVDARLANVARASVRAGYEAAASLIPGRIPPRPFDEHCVEIDIQLDEIDAIDGPSLALPAALAFVSLWTSEPIAPEIVASGGVRRGDRGYDVTAVGLLDEKAAGLSSRTGALLLVPERPETISQGVRVQVVSSVAGAVALAKLHPDAAQITPWESPRQIPHALRTCIEDVTEQRLDKYRSTSADPWLVLAERMSFLLDVLDPNVATDRRLASEAAGHAALAYLHAGDVGSAMRMAGRVKIDLATGSDACFVLIARATASIDGPDWDAGAQTLEDLNRRLAQLSVQERDLLGGMALGTEGRFLMHRAWSEPGRASDLPDAVTLLERAVKHHDAHLPHESSRSRTYLATALRMAGRAEEGLQVLLRAHADLSSPRMPIEYAATTEVFITYELARTLLAMGHVDEALDTILAARERATAMGSWWPLAGILRTQAWAHAAAGNPREQQRVADEIDALRSRAPSLSGFLEKLAAEARGGPVDRGIVD